MEGNLLAKGLLRSQGGREKLEVLVIEGKITRGESCGMSEKRELCKGDSADENCKGCFRPSAPWPGGAGGLVKAKRKPQ